ncbi:DUF2975 domain-containing protein [Bosea sp. F3-2]|uniref:DUF2975 domain-containing protein n=1 Tax=Bosea sp. F3-2 TaxID=2599640 RepID=UPI0011EF1EA1|nr:DUF2975 domain-containing protein [Bosea sp. F3-2]QEL26271.1 DUF2975 domain-containing protein [Bosea sp. F3-2]
MPMSSRPVTAFSQEAAGRLRRVSRWARAFSYAAALLMLFGLLWLWTDAEALARHARSTIGLGNAPLASSARGYRAAFALAWIPAALFVLAMLRLGSLFRAFGEGRVLVEENAAGLLRVGWLLAGFGAATPIVRTAQSMALTFDNPEGQRHIAVMLDPGIFAALAAGATLIAFGLVLREAIRLSDENQSFV